MTKLPETCPICQSNLVVTRFYCPNCESSAGGYFQREADSFSKLTKDQREFLLTFVRTEGRLIRMEETLGISYPTLKNRLNEVIHALGLESEKQPVSSAADPKQILGNLENGLIVTEEALTLLQPLGSKTGQQGAL